ncbi:MAG: hypothetical protein AAGI37_10315 [Planctomycetota bacterium]
MDRIKTQHEYHDADIINFHWEENDELVVRALLDAHWNHGFEGPVSWRFISVRNRDVIEASMPDLTSKEKDASLANIAGIRKVSGGVYLIDATEGEITIEAASVVEC